MPAFARYIGVDYSGANSPTASLRGPGVVRGACGNVRLRFLATLGKLRRDSLRPPLRCGRRLVAGLGFEPRKA